MGSSDLRPLRGRTELLDQCRVEPARTLPDVEGDAKIQSWSARYGISSRHIWRAVSLASTTQMRELLARLGPNDRVLLIGGTRQHQGLEAGRPFEQLQQAGMHIAKLEEIVRQRDPALKSAVELLATGQSVAALDLLQRQSCIREIPDRPERILAIARDYADSSADTLIVSPDNASRRELNVAVREQLRTNGALSPEDHSFRVLIQRQDMTAPTVPGPITTKSAT